jgi:hypothetical protein
MDDHQIVVAAMSAPAAGRFSQIIHLDPKLRRARSHGAGHEMRLSRRSAARRQPGALRRAPHARHHLSRRELGRSG